MFINIIQVLLILAIFFPIKWLGYKITEEWGLPKWLDYKPWSCNLCLSFWSLLATYLSIGLIFNLFITLIGGIALTIMNALAMWIDQKSKTISIEDYDKILNK